MFRYLFDSKNDFLFEDQKTPSLVRFSINQDDYGWEHPMAVHNDRLEIDYIEKGTAYYNIDKNTVAAKSGEIVIIQPGSLHSVMTNVSDQTQIWVLHVKDFKIKGISEENKLLKSGNFIVLSLKDHQEFMKSMLNELCFLCQKRGSYASGIINSAACMLISLLYDMQDDSDVVIVPNSYNNSFIRELIEYMNNNYMKDLTLQSIAEHFHISTSQLSHKFKKTFSISPINYLINQRLYEAKWRLIDSDDSLEEIAYSLGYNNINHFKNTFTKRTGCSPSRYRELYREKIQTDSDNKK